MATDKTPKLNLFQKLLSIQKQINGLGKDKAAFGYKYVTGDKVLEHLKPLMNDLGVLLKQEVISIENTRQDYKTKNGETSEINSKVMMRFTWVDAETGEKDENLFGANGQNAWDKGVGSALTYGERYFLLKYFHIATDEDDIDNPERKPAAVVQPNPAKVATAKAAMATVPTSEPKPATEAQIAKIKELVNHELMDTENEEKAHKRLASGLTEAAAEKAIQYYQAIIDDRTAKAA